MYRPQACLGQTCGECAMRRKMKGVKTKRKRPRFSESDVFLFMFSSVRQPLRKISDLLSRSKLRYVHQLATNYVCRQSERMKKKKGINLPLQISRRNLQTSLVA